MPSSHNTKPETQKKWRIKNAKHWLNYHRNYRAKNIDRLREYWKQYYGTPERKAKVKENLIRWRNEHRKEYNAYSREYYKKYREEHKEQINAYYREYRARKKAEKNNNKDMIL